MVLNYIVLFYIFIKWFDIVINCKMRILYPYFLLYHTINIFIKKQMSPPQNYPIKKCYIIFYSIITFQ